MTIKKNILKYMRNNSLRTINVVTDLSHSPSIAVIVIDRINRIKGNDETDEKRRSFIATSCPVFHYCGAGNFLNICCDTF